MSLRQRIGIIGTVLFMCVAMTGCGKIQKTDFDGVMSEAGIKAPDTVCGSLTTFEYNFFTKSTLSEAELEIEKERYGADMDKNSYSAGYFIMADKSVADSVFNEYCAYLEDNGFEELTAYQEGSVTYFNSKTSVYVQEIGPFGGSYDEKYHGKYGINVSVQNTAK